MKLFFQAGVFLSAVKNQPRAPHQWNSKYGKGFGLMPENSILNQHNSIYGLIFFIIQLLLCKCFKKQSFFAVAYFRENTINSKIILVKY